MKTITINVTPDAEQEEIFNAGVMYEHNAVTLCFNVDSSYINSDYKYYIDFITASGVLRTEYLKPDVNNTVSFLVPANITSQMTALCYFNIVRIDPKTFDTVEVIKPKTVTLNFSTVAGADKELLEQYDFSVNSMLEAIRNGDFKGDKGEKGDKGDKGEKGDKGDKGEDGVTVDAEITAQSANPVSSSAIKSYIDGKKISMIIDCPAFTNQPTINEAELNFSFVPWNVNYYYVHIVDSAVGKFKLMTVYDDETSCIEQTFTLSGLNTGNSGVLKENSLVDFLAVGENWQMRSAGVSRVGFSLLNSNYISLTFNGFSDMSGYIHVLSITGVNSYDYSCATGSLSSIYPGASGYLFGTTKLRKNVLVSCNLDIAMQSRYIDFSGNYFYKKTAENNRINNAPVDNGIQSIKGVLYKNDMGDLPISVIRDFTLIADGQFLNGTELTAVGKERF